jgi:Uma2 family endonuclease
MIGAMTALPQTRITVDEYLAWAAGQPGRYELYDGTVYAMSPEGAGHADVKFAVQTALAAGIRARGLPCHMLPDGMTVRVDARTAFEPDALVYRGSKVAPSAVEIPNPVIVVEVLPPSTRHIDASKKLAGYFRLPSVAHYLIVDPDQRLILHHARDRRHHRHAHRARGGDHARPAGAGACGDGCVWRGAGLTRSSSSNRA